MKNLLNDLTTTYQKRPNIINLVILFNSLLLSYFILISFRPIPDSTHFLVSFFNNGDQSDLLNWSILFIKTPIYQLIGNFFHSPLKYTLASYLINILFINSIFFVLLKISKKEFLSFFVICLIIFFCFTLKISTFLKLDVMNFLNHFFLNADILKNFTVRQFFGIFFLFSLYFLIKKKYSLSILLLFLNNFIHPNSNLFCLLILLTFFIWKSFEDKNKIKYVLITLLINSIFFINLFIKVKEYPNLDLELDHLYYVNLIKDEADDFSFLWLFSYQLNYILIIFIIHLSNIIFYFKSKKRIDDLIFLCALPLVLFLLGGLTEFLNIFLKLNVIDKLIINTQPSWKLLGYSFLPFLMILIKNLEQIEIFDKVNFQKITIIFTLLVVTLFSFIGLARNHQELKVFFQYALNTNHEENYEDWLKAYSAFNNYNYFPPFLENVKIKIDKSYVEERNIFNIKEQLANDEIKKYNDIFKFEDGYKLVKAIKQKIPKNNGIIIPPYIFNYRGSLKDHLIFFEEHPDGNFAMGNIKFFKVIHSRMIDLFGFGYSNFPNKQSGMNSNFMRQQYLKVNEKQIINISKKYKKFKFFITEKNHSLDFPKIYVDNSFVIYEIKK